MSKYSLTKIKMFEQCGAKYKYRYIDRIPEKQNYYSARGSQHHKSIEDFINEGKPMLEEVSYLGDWLGALKEHEVPLHVEFEVDVDKHWLPVLDGGEVHLQARLDLYRRDGEAANAYDWKSGKIYPDHMDQKELYTGILFGSQPTLERVTFVHVYTDLQKNTEKVFERHRDFKGIKEKWDRKVEKIENTPIVGLIPRPHHLCSYCGFRKSAGGPCAFG